MEKPLTPPKPGRKITIRELLRPHKKALTLGFLAAIGDAAANLLDPIPLKIVLDNVLKSKAASDTWLNSFIISIAGADKFAVIEVAAVGVVVIAAVGAVCNYVQKVMTTSVGQWV